MSDIPGFAAALGRIPSGVFIVTAGHGVDASGMLASWVQQCSFEPPQLSVAVKRERHLASMLTTNAAFNVNVIAAGHVKFFTHFGKGFGAGELAFEGIETYMGKNNVPILSDSLAHLECLVVDRVHVGDHDLIIGRVQSGALHSEGSPSVHIRKSGLHY